jgi:TrmH family RNA methyltransferase
MRYLRIASASNPHVREATQIRDRRTKNRKSTAVIEGPHLAEMALNAGAEFKEVFVSATFLDGEGNQELLRRLAKAAQHIFEVTDRILGKITDTEAPQGIAAVVSFRKATLDALGFSSEPFLVIADSIQDPGNLGSIIRTADAAGADAVVLLPGTCDAFMPKVIRATSGSIFTIPVVYTELDGLMEWLQDKKIPLAVTAAEAGKDIFAADLSGPVAVVFGNEARGVGSKLKQAAGITLRIPIFGRAESLNVAASAAVCLYEIVRQRRG